MMDKAAEDAFIKRSGKKVGKTEEDVTLSQGISSFMLTAGVGALSKALTRKAEEEEEEEALKGRDRPLSLVTTTFEDFEEIRRLGEGTFGKVFLVKHRETGEHFAMKLMDKAKFKAEKNTSKAYSEQFILKTTKHPFIVALHYAFQGSTFWALVMEFCTNGDLHDILVRDGTPGLKIAEAARYSAEILLALEHLHSIQVIFRDMKLENVLVDVDYHAKLADFGLSKKLYTTAEARTMCGSYGYVAPEIMSHATGYSYSVDLYSFGVTIYMLLSGGDTPKQKKDMRVPPMKHATLNSKLKLAKKVPPGDWALPEVGALELLQALCSEDPQQRTTCSEVKQRRFFTVNLGVPVDSLLPPP
jgi:serum/glucocorticoid-regulated kinase 2